VMVRVVRVHGTSGASDGTSGASDGASGASDGASGASAWGEWCECMARVVRVLL
jgi:hypothetical protein